MAPVLLPASWASALVWSSLQPTKEAVSLWLWWMPLVFFLLCTWKHNHISHWSVPFPVFVVGDLGTIYLFSHRHDGRHGPALVAWSIGNPGRQQTHPRILENVLLDCSLGWVEVGQIEYRATMAAVKDGSQSTSLGQRLDQVIVKFLQSCKTPIRYPLYAHPSFFNLTSSMIWPVSPS